MLGGPVFVAYFGDFDAWPLEPLAIYKGMPILIVRGYVLAGYPETSLAYLEYCLSACTWRTHRYAPMDEAARRRLVREFIDSKPELRRDADWLLAQAD